MAGNLRKALTTTPDMAQLDPSIILGAKPLQIRDPLESFGNALAIQSAQQNNALRAQQMQQANEDRAYTMGRRKGLNALLSQGLSGEELENRLLRDGYSEEALKFGKDRRENLKTDAERKKAESETSLKQQEGVDKSLQRYRGALDFINTPEDAVRWMQAQYNDPLLANTVMQMRPLEQAVQSIPRDPAQFQKWREQAGMGMDKYIANQTMIRGQNLTAETARRGQNMTDAREREVPRGMPLETASGPVLVNPRTGQAQPITIDGKAVKSKTELKPPTTEQANAALYSQRMENADKVIGDLEGQYSRVGLSAKQAVGGLPIIGQTANAALSNEGQQIDQAQRDFINATLRRESGAAISPGEFDNARQQYFPQPGDKPEVVRQKAQNRRTAIDGIRAAAGNAATKLHPQQSAPTSDIDVLLEKYKD